MMEVLNTIRLGVTRMVQKPRLQEVLDRLSKEELIAIVTEAAERDSKFKNSLLMKHDQGVPSAQIQSCKKLIAEIVKDYTGREGLIPYRQTHGFASDMLRLLHQHSAAQDPLLNLDVALLVLEEGVEAFQYADDSDGEIGMLVNEALERIRELANHLQPGDEAVRRPFFERLLQMSQNSVFDGWEDFRIGLLEICTEFADVAANREQLVTVVEKLIEDNTESEYWKHSREPLLGILFTYSSVRF
ncbi:hypothetical protein C2I18_01510 [Paenibacillus sp. PK3_47]|uniref:hypothetical protein n=1 Tax=Paenibacillus sp. PK3_47 TaxID=2072642 RepID=UPI00201DC667|nr:hypothetical protein [Paenibacillus sp. PK3_47]UQZ32339.1 hypothetical protein C2I18_01510 [Paenibacillus sp. PK3_47]